MTDARRSARRRGAPRREQHSIDAQEQLLRRRAHLGVRRSHLREEEERLGGYVDYVHISV